MENNTSPTLDPLDATIILQHKEQFKIYERSMIQYAKTELALRVITFPDTDGLLKEVKKLAAKFLLEYFTMNISLMKDDTK